MDESSIYVEKLKAADWEHLIDVHFDIILFSGEHFRIALASNYNITIKLFYLHLIKQTREIQIISKLFPNLWCEIDVGYVLDLNDDQKLQYQMSFFS